MGIKVNSYVPTSSVDTSGKTTITDIPEGESFQNVLVLNQVALKAMTIDAMVKQSATGSVNPDSVDAAAIMKFRSTLGSNVKAPIPEDDWDGGTPIKVHVPPATPTITKPATNNTVNTPTTNTPVTDTPSADTPCVETPIADTPVADTPVVDTPVENESTENAPVVNQKNESSGSITDTIPNTGVLKCSDELNQYFLEASKTYGVDVKLLKCIAYAESSFDPTSTSHSGAMGIMQLMPKTAEGLGVNDAYDPQQSIMGGAKYISIQLERFDGDIELALASYNAGPGNVKKYNGIPPFEETQNYVKKIMNIYNS